MTYTKAPWGVDDIGGLIGIRNKTNCAIATTGVNSLPQNQIDAERIVACVNACKGITNEALEKGILDDAIALVLNAGKSIGVTWDGMTPYYEGVKVWEE